MKLALLGAVALATTALVTPVKAQEVITNPGRCAQYYPNANCQNLGPGNPYRTGWQDGYAHMEHRGWHHHYHRHHHHH